MSKQFLRPGQPLRQLQQPPQYNEAIIDLFGLAQAFETGYTHFIGYTLYMA